MSRSEDDSDPYRDPSGVLINLLGETDAKRLRAVEYELAAAKQRALLDGSLEIPIREHNSDRLRFIHRELFDGIYGWAGQERTIVFWKLHAISDNHVGYFAEPTEFPALRAALAEKTAAFLLGTGSKEEAAVDLTEIYSICNDYHPFPEGNGRATQTFMRLLARERGLDLDFTRIDPDEWNHAAYLTIRHGEVIEENGEKVLKEEARNLAPMRGIFERMMQPWVRDYVPTTVDQDIAQILGQSAAALRAIGYDPAAPGFSEGLKQAVTQKYEARSDGEKNSQEPPPPSPSRPRSR